MSDDGDQANGEDRANRAPAFRDAPRRWRTARFDAAGDEPPDPLANLLDLMLVFACGLIAALIGMSDRVDEHFRNETARVVEKGAELPSLPDAAADGGIGYEAVGQVYRDPDTGKLILIGD